MSKVSIKMIALFGLLLGCIRIALYYSVTHFKFDPGYAIDVFFAIYLPLCLLMLRPKKIYSLLNLIATSIIIGATSIIFYQIFLTIKGHPILNEEYLLSRAIAALTVLLLSSIGAILFYLIQVIFKNKWETPPVDIDTIGNNLSKQKRLLPKVLCNWGSTLKQSSAIPNLHKALLVRHLI